MVEHFPHKEEDIGSFPITTTGRLLKWLRGLFAKQLGLETGAKVQILYLPPN